MRPRPRQPDASGLEVLAAPVHFTFATPAWAAVALWVGNRPGQAPWRPGRAALVGTKTEQRVEARAVVMKAPPLAPGQTGRVVIQTGPLPASLREDFMLELWDAEGGRPLATLPMTFNPPGGEPGKVKP